MNPVDSVHGTIANVRAILREAIKIMAEGPVMDLTSGPEVMAEAATAGTWGTPMAAATVAATTAAEAMAADWENHSEEASAKAEGDTVIVPMIETMVIGTMEADMGAAGTVAAGTMIEIGEEEMNVDGGTGLLMRSLPGLEMKKQNADAEWTASTKEGVRRITSVPTKGLRKTSTTDSVMTGLLMHPKSM